MDFLKLKLAKEFVKRLGVSILLFLLMGLLISSILNSRYEIQTFQRGTLPGIIKVDKWTGKIWLKTLSKEISESYENQKSLSVNDPDVDALDREVKSGLTDLRNLPTRAN